MIDPLLLPGSNVLALAFPGKEIVNSHLDIPPIYRLVQASFVKRGRRDCTHPAEDLPGG
ncbi:hypothetical protein [Qipengyuania gaetbuli]|uniref:hypothetical protein n=1 Tax=Qipengyuania gaetbuli TaxID=266952 RepID=UPI00147843D8|nr:hypothetical protein [Qipengyuania gaetbuli]